MVKKMKSTGADDKAGHADKGSSSGGAGGLFDSALANSVKESAQQIWLAGMGAFAKAQVEGGKVFETLVKEGQTLQKKTQHIAEGKLGDISGKMSSMADTVTAKAGQNWDKLESIFEDRTAKAMGKLGVPTAGDFDAMAQRIDELEARLGRMSRPAARPAAAPRPTAKTAPPTQPVAAKRRPVGTRSTKAA